MPRITYLTTSQQPEDNTIADIKAIELRAQQLLSELNIAPAGTASMLALCYAGTKAT